MWDQQVTLTIDFSQVLTPKCHLLLLTVFGDRKVFPQAMKGFKSRGEEGEAGTHTHRALKCHLFDSQSRVTWGEISLLLLPPSKTSKGGTYCWPIENAKITMLTFFHFSQIPLKLIGLTKYQFFVALKRKRVERTLFWKSNFVWRKSGIDTLCEWAIPKMNLLSYIWHLPAIS